MITSTAKTDLRQNAYCQDRPQTQRVKENLTIEPFCLAADGKSLTLTAASTAVGLARGSRYEASSSQEFRFQAVADSAADNAVAAAAAAAAADNVAEIRGACDAARVAVMHGGNGRWRHSSNKASRWASLACRCCHGTRCALGNRQQEDSRNQIFRFARTGLLNSG